jgi:hypothetical protein
MRRIFLTIATSWVRLVEVAAATAAAAVTSPLLLLLQLLQLLRLLFCVAIAHLVSCSADAQTIV